MRRTKVSSEELERRLAGQNDPVRRLPLGYPTMHARIRSTPSKYVVAAIEAVEARGVDDTPDAEYVKRREAAAARREAAVASRRRR